jgi:hypothetical protein
MVTLREMKDAVGTYFHDFVKSSVSSPTAQEGDTQVNPDENFTFRLSVANAVGILAITQGVQILNVIYHVRVSDPTKAKLIVPPTEVGVAHLTPSPDSPILPPGAAVNEMFLFPSGDLSTLGIGETDSLVLTGLARAVGTPSVIFNILGDVSLDLTHRSNPTASTIVSIVD